MIGPLPPPIHGMSLANRMLRDGLLERGHKVETLNTHTGTSFGNLKNQGRFTPSKLVRSVCQILRGIVLILFGPKLDVVYITPAQSEWGYLKYTPFIFSSAIRKTKVFIHIHGGYFRTMFDASKGWKRRLIKKSLDCLSGAIVLGPSLRNMFEGLMPEEKIFVCPNAVEDEIFATKEEIEEKISLWEKDDTIRIVYLGNLMRSKGIIDLLEAVKGLQKEGFKVHLDVAGAIEPDVEQEVRKFFSELGEIVTYHGVVQGRQKKNLLLRNYAFCLPSKHPFGEGQPISILEAMANGCGIVTTNHGGIKDVAEKAFSLFWDKGDNENQPLEIVLKQTKSDLSLFAWEAACKNYREKKFVNNIINFIK